MKRFALTLICLTLIFAIVVSAAMSNKSISWYFKPTTDNSRPGYPSEAPFLSEQNGIYLAKDTPKVYLTFDLGYENENVKKILDTMKKRNVKGAFFILQHELECGEYLNQIIEDGHLVCNHTCHHKDMTKIYDTQSFNNEVLTLEKLYEEKTGQKMAKLFRPPEGKFSEQMLFFAKNAGYKTLFWSLAYADWDNDHQMNPDDAVKLLMSRIHNGAIILLHPTSKTNGEILDTFITKLTEKGYEIGDPKDLL